MYICSIVKCKNNDTQTACHFCIFTISCILINFGVSWTVNVYAQMYVFLFVFRLVGILWLQIIFINNTISALYRSKTISLFRNLVSVLTLHSKISNIRTLQNTVIYYQQHTTRMNKCEVITLYSKPSHLIQVLRMRGKSKWEEKRKTQLTNKDQH